MCTDDTSVQPFYWDTVEDFVSPFTGILPRDIRRSVRERERQRRSSPQAVEEEKRRLEEEVSGMEEELSGMDRPLSAASVPRTGAISTKDLLKEFGEDLGLEDNPVELREAERKLERDDLVSLLAV